MLASKPSCRRISILAASWIAFFVGCGDDGTDVRDDAPADGTSTESESTPTDGTSTGTATTIASEQGPSDAGGSTTEGTASTDGSGDESDTTVDETASAAGHELVLPMRPRTAMLESLPYTSAEDGRQPSETGGPGLLVAKELSFALAEGYPATLEIRMTGVYDLLCGQISGRVVFETGSMSTTASAEVRGEDSVAVTAHQEGDATLDIQGRMLVDEAGLGPCAQDPYYDGASEIALTWRLEVAVRALAGVRVSLPSRCKNSAVHYVESDAAFPPDELLARPTDSTGDSFSPHNADPDYPIDLVVTADPGTSLWLASDEEGLSALRASGPEGPIRIVAPVGEPTELMLVPAERIETLTLGFSLAGAAGHEIRLTSGETYGATGFSRTSNAVVPTVHDQRIGDSSLCTLPRPEGFVLTSATPTTCPAPATFNQGLAVVLDHLGIGAEVIASGVCSLTLAAPWLAGGQGSISEISVTFLNAEELFDVF